jgi:PAS domain S-box-containing protein
LCAGVMRVLYVDDEEGLLDVGKLFLEKDGEFSVDTVLSASAALNLLETTHFDAIVSDYKMPEMDGIAFLKEVRSRFDTIPFILFTGRGREEVVIEALNEGADFYLQKGGQPTAQFAELMHKIKKSVTQRQAERELSVANDEIKIRLEEEKLFSDFSQFLLNATSVDEVLEYFGNLVFARSGADYLMLGKLFTRENAIGIHSLRGFGPLLGQMGTLIKAAPESLKVPVDVIIAHSNEIPLEPGLRKLEGGIFTISRGYLSKPVCAAIENLLRVNTIFVYELVWEGNLYGSVTFGFRQGHGIQNPSLINTLGNLLSNGLWRIYSTDAITSERKTLAESEGKFRTIFENSPYPISINSTPDGKFIAVNNAFLQSSGYTEPEIMGKNPVELGLLSAVDFGRLLSQMVVKGRLDNISMTLVGKGGKRVHVQYSTLPVRINDTPAVMTVTAEITRLKRVEEELLDKNEELRANEARLNSIIRVAPVGIGVVSDRIIQTVNDRLCRMTGYTAEELTGKSARILYPAQEDFDYVGREKYAQIAQNGSGSVETRWQKKDGTILDILLSSTPINPSDLSAGVTFTALDITERNRAEKLVRESENKFATVFRNNPVALTLVSAADGRFVDVSDAFVTNTGFSREEVIGRTSGDLGIFTDAREYDQLVSRLRNGQPVKGMEVRVRQKNGGDRACQFTSVRILMQGSPHILSTIEDITDKKNADLAFQAMTLGMVGTTGRESLDRITESIRLWLGGDCIMIGEILPDRKRVNVLSMLLDGKKVEDHSYTLEGTPCDNTADKGFCLFPDNVASLFPASRDLRELNIRGYAGTPLRSADGSVIGILCILTRKPLVLPPEGRKILDIIAVKATAEIERKRVEERLTRINEVLLNLGTDHRNNIDSLTRLCGEMLGADCVLYNRLDAGLLSVIGQWNCPPDLPSRDRPEGHICFDVIREDRDGPLVVCDLQNSPYATSDPHVAACGLKTCIGHPVRFGGVNRGSLCAVYTRDVVPTVGDLEIIGILSSAVAQEEKRREADQALRESEERFRSFIGQTLEGISLIDEEGRIIEWNPAQEQLTGMPRSGVMGVCAWDLATRMIPDSGHREAVRSRMEESIKKTIASGITTHPDPIYYTFHRPDGTTAVARQTIFIVKTTQGHMIGTVSQDVTREKHAEEKIKESEARYRTVVEQSNDAIFIAQDGILVFHNPAFLEMTGYTDSELTGMSIADLIAPEDRDLVLTRHRERLGGKILPKTYEFSVLHHDGSTRIRVVMNVSPATLAGQPATIGTLHNVTRERNQEEALRESENRYRSVIENIHAAVVVHNPDTSIRMINTAALDLLGLSPDEAMGRTAPHPSWHFTREDGSVLSADEYPVNTVITTQKPIRNMLIGILRPKSRDTIWGLLDADPEYDEKGSLSAILVTFTDITGRKQADEALRQANRKLNLLSGITRHDIKNQLLTLNGFLEISKKYSGDAARISNFIDREKEIAKTMERQIAFTKEYEAIGVNAPVWQDCRTLIETAARQALSENVTVKNDILSGFEVFADPLIAKAVYNLMDNAVRHGKKISTIRFSAEDRNNERTVVCEDDGIGVPAEEKERIFERGFGKNTGMGLFLTREILSITGITIHETGEPGTGARFEITVPKGAWRIITDRE